MEGEERGGGGEGGSPYYILLPLVKNSHPASPDRPDSLEGDSLSVYKKAVADAVVTAIKSPPSFLVPLQNAASDDRPGTADRGGNYGVLGCTLVGRATLNKLI